MSIIRTILHPTDFSERSQAALHVASSLARDEKARLIILHVLPAAPAHAEGIVQQEWNAYHDKLWNRLQRLDVPNSGIELERRLADGEPWQAILRVVQEERCDLIVMGTHGRTGVYRLLMGSVAEQVVRRATCPVLTLKTPIAELRTEQQALAAEAVGGA